MQRLPAETPAWREKFDQACALAAPYPLAVYQVKLGRNWYLADARALVYTRPEGPIRRKKESRP